ncbi:hypothetical protein ACFVHB_38745 [Kitasatospora sp. NPDC127111]|uniref:hypothetical protein n=1 Tax=Kitasatospora sp. NPDC127111 TaxID=3345363 RepID=UPI0036447A03
MTTEASRLLAPDTLPDTPPPPRWAVWVAHAVPLIALPSTLWRLAMTVGVPVGYSEAVLRSDYGLPGTGYLVLPAISLLQEGAALMTLGLVRPWGEVVPRWIPLIGGRPVRTWAAVTAALLGAAFMTALTVSQAIVWDSVDGGNLRGTHRAVMGWLYMPLLLWGPLLTVVALNYAARRRRTPGSRRA